MRDYSEAISRYATVIEFGKWRVVSDKYYACIWYDKSIEWSGHGNDKLDAISNALSNVFYNCVYQQFVELVAGAKDLLPEYLWLAFGNSPFGMPTFIYNGTVYELEWLSKWDCENGEKYGVLLVAKDWYSHIDDVPEDMFPNYVMTNVKREAKHLQDFIESDDDESEEDYDSEIDSV